jgi:hypothetical protein
MLRVIARVRVQHFDPMLAWEASQQRRSRSNGEIFVLRKILARVFVVALLLGMPGIAVSAEPLPLFSSEQKAQQHCPSDIVVWLNLPSGIYHLKGQRWYGRTKNGAYVCKKEADEAGDRPSLKG